jgi:hypothetical protein
VLAGQVGHQPGGPAVGERLGQGDAMQLGSGTFPVVAPRESIAPFGTPADSSGTGLVSSRNRSSSRTVP